MFERDYRIFWLIKRQSMDYRHDIFFSYKRDALTLDWHRWVKDRLVHWLTQEMGGRRIDCFMDEQIHTGEHWPDSLQQALLHSRCLVTVWSPEYFHPNWCVSEWRNFLEREKLLQGICLIAPVRYHDGSIFHRKHGSFNGPMWSSSPQRLQDFSERKER